MRVPNPGISINNFLRFLMQDSISLNFYIASNPDWQQNSQDGINSMTVPLQVTRDQRWRSDAQEVKKSTSCKGL